jgi:hypothetical protein
MSNEGNPFATGQGSGAMPANPPPPAQAMSAAPASAQAPQVNSPQANSPNAENPYAAPRAAALEAPRSASEASLVTNGRSVAAGRGLAWLTEAWGYFIKAPGPWIGIVVVGMIITIVLAFIPVLGSVATIFLGPVFVAGLMRGCKELDDGGSLRFDHLFAGFKENIGQLMLVALLYLVGGVVILAVLFAFMGVGLLGMFTGGGANSGALMGGSFVLMMVGFLVAFALFLPIAMAMWFAPALIVFHELSAIDAMKQSFVACLKNIVPFLIYGIVYLVASVFATLPFMLGWLVLGPMLVASIYLAYRDIFVA